MNKERKRTMNRTSDLSSVISNQHRLRRGDVSSLIHYLSYLKYKTAYCFTLIELLVDRIQITLRCFRQRYSAVCHFDLGIGA